jgi:hypothetical protein
MTLQNLNLLPDSYIEKKIPFSGLQVVQLNVGILILLSLIILSQYWTLHQLQKKNLALNSSVQSAQSQLDAFNGSHKKPEMDSALQDKVNAIQLTLKQNQQLNTQMSHLLSDQQQGFSVFLEALAAQHIDGIWLNAIDIADDGKRLILHGGTIEPSRVTEYLENLKQESVFQGRVFDDIAFDRDAKDTQIVNFVLTIGKAAEKSKGAGK